MILVAPGIVADDLAATADARLTQAYSAAAGAGLIAGLAPQSSPTNKTLAVSGLTTLYNDGQLKQLVGGRSSSPTRRGPLCRKPLLLFFTGGERSASEMFGHQVNATLAGDEAMAANLTRTQELAREVCEALESG